MKFSVKLKAISVLLLASAVAVAAAWALVSLIGFGQLLMNGPWLVAALLALAAAGVALWSMFAEAAEASHVAG